MRSCLLFLIGVCLSSPVLAELPGQDKLASELEFLQLALDLPSLSAAIRDDSGVVASAVGYADVEEGLVQSTYLSMPGGSTGKSFVAATAMRLVEEHAIELSDPIALYVGKKSWFQALEDGEKITVEHLLTHSSGVPDHVDDFDFALSALWRRIGGDRLTYKPQELIEFVLDDGLQFEPGTDFQYSDTGYLMLGLVLEAATELTYYELLDQLVLKPNQLQARPAVSDTMSDISQGYGSWSLLSWFGGFTGRLIEDGMMKIHPLTEWTGGGLMTTPRTLTQFYHQLANGQIVKPDTYAQMLAAGLKSSERGWHYGYGLYVDGLVVGHGGWFPGYTTNARYFGEQNVTIAFQSNTDADYDQRLIFDRLLALYTQAD